MSVPSGIAAGRGRRLGAVTCLLPRLGAATCLVLTLLVGSAAIPFAGPAPGDRAFTATIRPQQDEAVPGGAGEVTTQGRPLHFEIVHLIVNALEPGLFEVAQVVHVRNAGDTAWMDGTPLEGTGEAGRVGFVIPIPASARRDSVRPLPAPEGGLDPAAVVVQEERGRVVDTRPVPPGMRQVALTYELVVGGPGGIDVELTLPYPTQSVSLLVGGPAGDRVELTGTNLESRPDETIRDTRFAHWVSGALAPGDTISFTLAPRSSPIAPTTWALAGLAVALAVAFVYAWHGGPRPADTGPSRGQLLVAAARLDLARERGDIDEAEYFDRRGAILEDLADTDPAEDEDPASRDAAP